MLRPFVCRRGHFWEADAPPAAGDSTSVLPTCPFCGEVGRSAAAHPSRALHDDSTSRIDSAVLVIDGEQPAAGDPFRPPLLPDYELVEEIGRGGMGIVYRAIDRKRGGQVAIKCLRRLDSNKLMR